MENTDFAVAIIATSSATFVIAATFLNIFQSAIQIIGIGTAISLSIGVYKFYLDRKEGTRRQRLDGIRRLQPVIYNPTLKWAVATLRELDSQSDKEIHGRTPNPPDLTEEGDYIAIVGDKLRNQIQKAWELHKKYSSLALKLGQEYRDNLQTLIHNLGFDGDINSVYIVIDNQRENITSVPYDWSMSYFIERVENAKNILLDIAQPKQTVACPKEILSTIQNPETLHSFPDFHTTKNDLHAQLENLVFWLKEAITNGESDWNL